MRTGFLSALKSNTNVDIIGDFDGGGSGSDEIFRVYHSNNPANRLLTVLRDGKTGVGLVAPLAKMHIQRAIPTGAAAPNAAYDVLVIDNDDFNQINLRTPAKGVGVNSSSTISFSDDVWNRATITYQHSINNVDLDYYNIKVAGVTSARWNATGLLIGADVAPDSPLHVYGGNASQTAPTNTLLTLEAGAADVNLSFLSDTSGGTRTHYIYYGDQADATAGFISYSHAASGDTLGLSVGAARTAFTINESNALAALLTNAPTAGTNTVLLQMQCNPENGVTVTSFTAIEFLNESGAGSITISYAFEFESDFIENAGALQDDADQHIPIMTPDGKRWLQVKEVAP